MHHIEPVFVPHGLPETLLDPSDRGERNLDQVQREYQADEELGRTLRHNIAAVLKFAVDIENQFSRILSAYLVCIDRERQDFLDSALIRTSWCTFSIKSELALKVLSRSQLRKRDCTRFPSAIPVEEQDRPVSNAELKAVRKRIKDLGIWRNALAHGLISVSEDGDHRLYVNYFLQSPQQRELDEPFWKSIEQLMNEIADFIVPARMRMEIHAKGARISREPRHHQ